MYSMGHDADDYSLGEMDLNASPDPMVLIKYQSSEHGTSSLVRHSRSGSRSRIKDQKSYEKY
jgi:hypothetical protein